MLLRVRASATWLTAEERWNPAQQVDYDVSYGYDAVGNRTSMTRDGTNYTYSYDDNDKLTGVSGGGQSASFGYDSAGNMTGVSGTMFGSRTLSFDDESRLTGVTWSAGTNSYEYNALGQIKRLTLLGTPRRWVYFGDRVVTQLTDAGGLHAVMTLESGDYGGMLLGRRQASQNRNPCYDGVGTARVVVDDAGEQLYTYDPDGFGRYFGVIGNVANFPYRYGGAWGYVTDPTLMQQLGARFYWPEIGRFIQQDPSGDGMNWYAYVGNNPVVAVDPSGLCSFQLDLFAGIGVSFAVGYSRSNGLFFRTRAGVGVALGGSFDPLDQGRAAAGGMRGRGASYGIFETGGVGYGYGTLNWENVAGNAYDSRGNLYMYQPGPAVTPTASVPRVRKLGFNFSVGAESEWYPF